MPLTSLQSFLRQISNMLPLSQRWKIDQIHVLVGRRTGRQESLQPVLVALLFYGGDVVHLNMMSQIFLAFFLSSPCLFLFCFSPCFFLLCSPPQFFLLSPFLCHPCLFSCSLLCPLLLLFLPEFFLCFLSLFYKLLLVPFIIGVWHKSRINGEWRHCSSRSKEKISQNWFLNLWIRW